MKRGEIAVKITINLTRNYAGRVLLPKSSIKHNLKIIAHQNSLINFSKIMVTVDQCRSSHWKFSLSQETDFLVRPMKQTAGSRGGRWKFAYLKNMIMKKTFLSEFAGVREQGIRCMKGHRNFYLLSYSKRIASLKKRWSKD